jgi:hypothetical protein
MELTWIAILGSLSMTIAAVCIFIFALKKDHFHNIEDSKYQLLERSGRAGGFPQGEA